LVSAIWQQRKQGHEKMEATPPFEFKESCAIKPAATP
jgi:hypothetical protein